MINISIITIAVKYNMKFIVQSSFVAIFYIMCLVIAVKMLLPENKKDGAAF